MKTYLVLSFLFLALTSCNGTAPVSESAQSSSPGGGSAGANNPVSSSTANLGAPVSVVRVKNYNQYNMTLEKLTGLNRSTYNDLFDALKGSLPADNDIGGLTPFNLLAMTRLADAYCTVYVRGQTTNNVVTIAPKITLPSTEIATRDLLFKNFLDVNNEDEKFLSLRTEVDNVLNNDDGYKGSLFAAPTKSDLAIAACVTILASPYITLLE